MQNVAQTPAKRGRRPAFERSEVIAAAIPIFWEHGFNATTLTDLEAATGVDRSTLYNSFGGKEGLYHSATQTYLAQAEDGPFRPLHEGTEGIADVLEFLDRLRRGLSSAKWPPGCLIVNEIAAAADREAAERYQQLLDDGLKAALDRAAAAGETDPTRTEQRCGLLSAAVVGMNIISNHENGPMAVVSLIDGAMAEVSSWRIGER